MKEIIRNHFILFAVVMAGELLLFNSCNKQEYDESTVTDIDGNSYRTVRIGNQWWMAENLKTTKYNVGTIIPRVEGYKAWYELTNGAYCWYNDIIEYKEVYGHLYNWYVVNTGKLCPTGWHVPGYDEWTTLVSYLGGRDGTAGKLKETGFTHWQIPNEGANNKTGFTALPGGFRHQMGSYCEIGEMGSWWLSTETFPGTAWSISLGSIGNGLMEDMYIGKNWGLSVRCIRDY